MTAGRRHSTVFQALRNIRASLVAADWPSHVDELRPPDVGFAFDESPDHANERVAVLNRVEDDAVIDWSTISPANRDETYLIEIVIQSEVPGQTQDDVLSRLDLLAEVAEGVFYNPDTGDYVSPIGVPGTPGYYPLGGIARVTCGVFPVGDEGWGGQCSVVVGVAARI